MPDPLVCFDGRKVTDAAMWRETRRPEILRAFARHIYGRTPEIKTSRRSETIGADATVFDNFFTSREKGEQAYEPPFDVLRDLVTVHGSGGRQTTKTSRRGAENAEEWKTLAIGRSAAFLNTLSPCAFHSPISASLRLCVRFLFQGVNGYRDLEPAGGRP